jgi:hypothetical protein
MAKVSPDSTRECAKSLPCLQQYKATRTFASHSCGEKTCITRTLVEISSIHLNPIPKISSRTTTTTASPHPEKQHLEQKIDST